MTENGFDRAHLTEFRVVAESAFYTNNVEKVNTIEKAYKLALKNPGTIVTDQKVHQPQKIGYPKDAKVLLFNDGGVFGRTAAARRILGDKDVSSAKYSPIIREAVFELSRKEKLYHA
ncbi:MAG TPA: phosphoenolpyruvate carboxykinase, partial [bacterium]|nr:phosphoenolpyruvate carboxykinase [bacterium]